MVSFKEFLNESYKNLTSREEKEKYAEEVHEFSRKAIIEIISLYGEDKEKKCLEISFI